MTAKVIKRNNNVVDFNIDKIKTAIMSAMKETIEGIDNNFLTLCLDTIKNQIKNQDNKIFSIQQLQKMILDNIKQKEDLYNSYYNYMKIKTIVRSKNKNRFKLLDDDFISKYKHRSNPMSQLGSFIFYRTYSRWLNIEGRREYWWETVRRAVEANCILDLNCTKEEAQEIYDNMYNLRQFTSGRWLWIGGTKVFKKYKSAAYNCAMTKIENFEDFCELFYLLLLGCGVGFRVLPEDVDKISSINNNIKFVHKEFKENNDKLQNTKIIKENNKIYIIIGDSKEGWVDALRKLFKYLIIDGVIEIEFNYDNIRLKGEKLKTFGGTSSGYQALKIMFEKIIKIIKKTNKLKTIDCMDICNIIGENVVCGGVRRTSEVCGFDINDNNIMNAKSELYKCDENNNWSINNEIIHRQMSNNSIIFFEKPSRKFLNEMIDKMRYTGEPGFCNAEAALKRRDDYIFGNPCMEILLKNKQFCNLVTINVLFFVKNNIINKNKLLKAQKLNTRIALRTTLPIIELPEWDKANKDDRLLGCSLTGWQDMINITNMSLEEEKELLKELRNVAKKEAKKYSKELNINEPLLITTIKPEGTQSQLPSVSPGIHYTHSEFFIRRVRITINDPLLKVCEELKYPIFNEVGQNNENCTTKVIEFPCKSPKGKTKFDVSAIEQLENYKKFMTYYVDHNASITITVQKHEWEIVKEWCYDNWDDIIGITFLSLDDSFYKLMPYEAINEEEYNKRVKEMKNFIPSLLQKYEKSEMDLDIGVSECTNGVCPIR